MGRDTRSFTSGRATLSKQEITGGEIVDGQVDVKRQEKDHDDEDKDYHEQQDANRRSAAVTAIAQVPHQVDEDDQKLQGLCEQVEDEEEFVLLADAGAEPGTVVIEGSDALLAGVTVPHSERLIKLAYSAVSLGFVHEVGWGLRLAWLGSYFLV